MVKCNDCGRELDVVIPANTKIYCKLCAHRAAGEAAALTPRKTATRPLDEIISDYEDSLSHELERFTSIIKQPYHFEQPYALIGSQGRIDDLRQMLYWLKKLQGQEQDDIVDMPEW